MLIVKGRRELRLAEPVLESGKSGLTLSRLGKRYERTVVEASL